MPNSEDKIHFHLSIHDPILHTSWEDGQYTSYAISIETNSYSFSLPKSMVRRRYSEFVHLRKLLRSHHPSIKPPNLPPKAFFTDKFSETFIEKRRSGLEKFILKVVDVPLYLSNKSVHLFLQSSSDTQEIESIVGGDYQEPIRHNSHLLLHRFLSEDYASSDKSSECTDTEFQDCDLTDSTHSFPNHHGHLNLGNRIRTYSHSPSLHVPDDSSPTDCPTPSPTSEEESSDESNPQPRPASPKNIPASSSASPFHHILVSSRPASPLHHILVPSRPASPLHHILVPSRSASPNHHGSVASNSEPTSSVGSEPPVRKKKVSFCSEVTVAHVFTNGKEF